MPRIGFFTRLLERGSAAERYGFALEQIALAERLGFSSAWVAQHHFDGAEGGLPSPFVLLAAAAERTTSIRLGTGVLTLPLEQPIRAAEDASVLDAISGGRVELGVAAGGSPAAFEPFGVDPRDCRSEHKRRLTEFVAALAGDDVSPGGARVYPPGAGLERRIWHGTFSVEGARVAGERGDGLMLSRSQPRPAGAPQLLLAELQLPMVEAYLAALPAGVEPRILASRTVVVVDVDARTPLLSSAEPALRAFGAGFLHSDVEELAGEALLRATDTNLGTVDEVVSALQVDAVLPLATDVAVQVHSVPVSHELTLRSLELFASRVAPALGW